MQQHTQFICWIGIVQHMMALRIAITAKLPEYNKQGASMCGTIYGRGKHTTTRETIVTLRIMRAKGAGNLSGPLAYEFQATAGGIIELFHHMGSSPLRVSRYIRTVARTSATFPDGMEKVKRHLYDSTEHQLARAARLLTTFHIQSMSFANSQLSHSSTRL